MVMGLGSINKGNQNTKGGGPICGVKDMEMVGTLSKTAQPWAGKRRHMPMPKWVLLFLFGIPRNEEFSRKL